MDASKEEEEGACGAALARQRPVRLGVRGGLNEMDGRMDGSRWRTERERSGVGVGGGEMWGEAGRESDLPVPACPGAGADDEWPRPLVGLSRRGRCEQLRFPLKKQGSRFFCVNSMSTRAWSY
jgi:hypothetical protein